MLFNAHKHALALWTQAELKGVSIVSVNIVMTQNCPQPLKPPPARYPIIWLCTQAEDSKGWSYYLFSVTTQMVSQAARLMGVHVLFIARITDNDTVAQVVKCTPVIVLHQADEITLFKWHPTCPCSAGAPRR